MISYYDLLGMIKEGKQPKKVKYDDIIFNWCDCNYIDYEYDYLTSYLSERDMFEDDIEIIEKYNGIEKINIESRTLTMLQLEIIHKINELVVKINELERELNS